MQNRTVTFEEKIEEKDETSINKDKSLDISNFQAIVFQPNEEFYKSDFKNRLEILEKKIKLAIEYFKQNPHLKGIFVVA